MCIRDSLPLAVNTGGDNFRLGHGVVSLPENFHNLLFAFCQMHVSIPVSYTHLDVYKRQVIARVNSFQQLAHLVGRGLAVVVQADDDITAALVEARHQRGMLAEVFRQIHAQHMGVRRHQAADGANAVSYTHLAHDPV